MKTPTFPRKIAIIAALATLSWLAVTGMVLIIINLTNS